MSREAVEIELARRLYVRVMGTPMEPVARKYLEAVVARIKRKASEVMS